MCMCVCVSTGSNTAAVAFNLHIGKCAAIVCCVHRIVRCFDVTAQQIHFSDCDIWPNIAATQESE